VNRRRRRGDALSLDDVKALENEREREASLEESLRRYARLHGVRRYHTLRSDGSPGGFPDDVFLRPPLLIFAELKSEEGFRRHVRDLAAARRLIESGTHPDLLPPGPRRAWEQNAWIEGVNRCTTVLGRIWRPSDRDEAYSLLGPWEEELL
jgi:hypothetical protein